MLPDYDLFFMMLDDIFAYFAASRDDARGAPDAAAADIFFRLRRSPPSMMFSSLRHFRLIDYALPLLRRFFAASPSIFLLELLDVDAAADATLPCCHAAIDATPLCQRDDADAFLLL